MARPFILIYFIFVLHNIPPQISAYKHIIFMHGLFGGPPEFDLLKSYINKTHPGTTFSTIDAYDYKYSLAPMWTQVNKIKTLMYNVMKAHPNGVHLLCYSQGGLVCRAVLESLPNHNVINFISLSSPQAGQYGDTSYLKYLFPKYLKSTIYEFFYSFLGQEVSIGNYWNDPYHQSLYRDYSAFSAVINNQTENKNSSEFKKNFVKLKNLILIGGPQDDVIAPWQSSIFGFYDINGKIVNMEKQEWYTRDSFGLKTLDERGGLHTYIMPGILHHQWPRNYTVYSRFIQPWLT